MRWKILGVIVVAGIIAAMLFVCNPLMISRIDGSNGSEVSLEEIYSRVRPYVRMEHITLTDSGYYTVTIDNNIQSRFYMTDLGEQRCFVELSTDFLEEYPKTETLEDVSLTVKLVPSERIAGMCAASENMEPLQYRHTYNISSVTASEYRNNIAGVYIYYALATLLAIGLFLQKLNTSRQAYGASS